MLCAGIDAACLADMEQLDSLHQIDTLDVEFEDWSEEFEAAEEWAELLGRSCGTDGVAFATGRGQKPGHDVRLQLRRYSRARAFEMLAELETPWKIGLLNQRTRRGQPGRLRDGHVADAGGSPRARDDPLRRASERCPALRLFADDAL